jgi:hypothetical protein
MYSSFADEYEVRHWLRLIDGDMRKSYNEMANAEWDFETDMNNITSAHVSMQRQKIVKCSFGISYGSPMGSAVATIVL